MRQTFYSNGKLLLTGEYVVLDGAKALALPTKFGQDLVIESGKNHEIMWKSFDHDGTIWFEDVLPFSAICDKNYIEKNDSVRNTLIEILHEAYLLNPRFIDNSEGYVITTNLTFPKLWGLGTSSTLINNVAQWLQIDAFELLKNSFGGSGYDIACAQHNTPIVYQLEDEKPLVTPVDFHPGFADKMYFVYLNRKQSSKAAIASYYSNRQHNLGKTIAKINAITEKVLNASEVGSFVYELEKHESILSDILEMQTIKEAQFPDSKGVVKSLGGWGGDFILAVSKEDPSEYFRQRGFHTVIRYNDMIL